MALKSVLITGANGFLGSHLARHFARRGWYVAGVGRSPLAEHLKHWVGSYHCWTLPDPRLEGLLAEMAPEAVIHCAGRTSVADSFTDPEGDYTGGPVLLAELLEQVRRQSPRSRVLFLSSAAVYGEPAVTPIEEELVAWPISPYGWHKRQGEQLCLEYATRFDLRTASVRIFSAYGPGLRRQVVWDACRKLSGEAQPAFHGTGTESRDFIHVRDVARGIFRVVSRGSLSGECYNVGTGRETTIAALMEMVEQLLARVASGAEAALPWRRGGASVARTGTPRISFDAVLRPGVPRHVWADIGRLAGLGFRPRVTLERGLAQYVAWFAKEASCREHFAWA
jgi:UDP-glucose 4-epimerase